MCQISVKANHLNIKMKYIATGYLSIGHLFESDGDDNNTKENRTALQNLLEHVRITFDDATINKEHFRHFDTFFANLPVNIETSSQFFHCILKQPKADDVSYQLGIERLVWRIIRNNGECLSGLCLKHKNSHVEEENNCFHLFCIFNRFCETDSLPISLTDNGLRFLCAKFHINAPLHDFFPSFPNFMHLICEQKRNVKSCKVKEAYDELVRDILIEGRLPCLANTFAKHQKRHVKKGNLYILQIASMVHILNILCATYINILIVW